MFSAISKKILGNPLSFLSLSWTVRSFSTVNSIDTPKRSTSDAKSLAEHLKTLIISKGPLTISEFIKLALTHPTLGFYHNCDVIGKEQSHFITSPEINQVFGELMGIWCVAQWEKLGSPKKIELVELGPGRGTLMKDLLRAARHFPEFYNGLDIHLVEKSSGMRSKQKFTLDCKPMDNKEDIDPITGQEHMRLRDHSNIDVFWHNTIASIPHQHPSLIIAHEFLDALPVQKFQYTPKGWREVLVDLKEHLDWEVDESIQNRLQGTDHASASIVPDYIPPKTEPVSGEPEFKEILCPHNNLAATAMLGGLFVGEQVEQTTTQEESAFLTHVKKRKQLLEDEMKRSGGIVNSAGKPVSTPLSLLDANGLPLASEKSIFISDDIDIALRRKEGTEKSSTPSPTSSMNVFDAKEGDTIEICPEACMIIQDIIMWLEETKGSALFIDYGNNYASKDSLRGIKNHQFVPYLQEPGKVDVTADVDFKSLRRVVENSKSDEVRFHGPIPQGYFLCGLGIEERVRQMAEMVEEDDKVEDIIKSAERLVHNDQMGEIYKVCCITTGETPLGFEGENQFVYYVCFLSIFLNSENNEWIEQD